MSRDDGAMAIENIRGASVEQTKRDQHRIFSFFRDLRAEIKWISWTSKEELKQGTKLVVWATFAFGISIYVVDLTVKGSLAVLRHLFNFVFG
jgi:preprotein translocase subunit SecE